MGAAYWWRRRRLNIVLSLSRADQRLSGVCSSARMPTVSVEKEQLFAAIGQRFTDDEFRDKCFEFGIELDDIVNRAPAPSL
jgi:hypothetical protein